ncbi:regulatory signaling modulator protein AmpE [Alkalilimnicola sp. S0819]|uniref:regulatory signaling modulator protein AmpE n=1 Tax=Alkalilimnicola sp. S0819 TaxID=2613922 RepID=UPI0012616FB3|nr:regulatory signaling modulator protein AmpE [Alkalilimnicola sp. S0819]KAB7628216.1 regulatory signaling modulator protein AmpE [Alkalilimnicola sp. S0819]MPQ15107.1 regulatory signaling modulator protein AmpE [Alkalilimnicola sp. S0819]
MRLIAVLLAWWAGRYYNLLGPWRDTDWFHRYGDALRRRLSAAVWDGWLGLAALLAPLLLLTAFLQHVLPGPLLLLAGVAVLLYAQGQVRLDEVSRRYLRAEQHEQPEGQRAALAELGSTPPAGGEPRALCRDFVAAMFWHAYRYAYAPVFWYLLLGPFGVVLQYGLVLTQRYAERYEGHQQGLRRAAGVALYWVDWLPVRLCALALALAGDFGRALQGWRQGGAPGAVEHAARLGEVGLGALGGLSPETPVAQSLYDARALITRGVTVWLGVVALLVITGWWA